MGSFGQEQFSGRIKGFKNEDIKRPGNGLPEKRRKEHDTVKNYWKELFYIHRHTFVTLCFCRTQRLQKCLSANLKRKPMSNVLKTAELIHVINNAI